MGTLASLPADALPAWIDPLPVDGHPPWPTGGGIQTEVPGGVLELDAVAPHGLPELAPVLPGGC